VVQFESSIPGYHQTRRDNLRQYIILSSVRQHNHFITQGNYKSLVILRHILSIVSQGAMHTLGSHVFHGCKHDGIPKCA